MQNQENVFLPLVKKKGFNWKNIYKNIDNNKEEIINKLEINSDEEFKLFIDYFLDYLKDEETCGNIEVYRNDGKEDLLRELGIIYFDYFKE
jgi:hypothetical protein